MSLRAAAYYAGWTHALDTAETHADCDCGRRAIGAARFDGIASAETPDHLARTLDAAAAAVTLLLDTAAAQPSAVVERVARQLVVDDLDAASEALTLLAILAREWRSDALERAVSDARVSDGLA